MARLAEREPVGRDEELARLSAFLDGIAVGAARLVLEGEAGIGKTELWRSAVGAARGRGYTVLESRPSEAERELTFAGLADLLGDVIHELGALPAPQRRPLSTALLLEDDAGAPPDARAIGVATVSLLRHLAFERPVLVAVDDIQWLDRPSGAALAFALRRLGSARVGALLARRIGEPGAEELHQLENAERITVRPLSLGALRRLLGERLGVSYSRTTLRRLHERAGGNPFFALELARALGDREVGAGEELPLPEDLRQLLRARLSELPPETVEPLAAIAALGEPSREVVGAEASLEPAFASGVLVYDRERVRFAHPLLASAAYEALAPARRRELHRRLSGVVDDPEQQARHLALGADGPDPELAGLLERAASQAHARGAIEAAVDLIERALVADDRSDLDAYGGRVATAARYHFVAGDFARARALVEDALEVVGGGPVRGRLLYLLGLSSDAVDAQRSLLEAALAEARGDERLEVEILIDLGALIAELQRISEAEPYLRAAVDAAERMGDSQLLARALSELAGFTFLNGGGVDRALMERALALDPYCNSLPIGTRPVTKFGWMTKWVGDVDRSRELLYEACRLGDERGDIGVNEVLFYTCFLELLRGDWRRGLALADRICEMGIELERNEFRLAGFDARAALLAHLGDEDGARRDARAAFELGEALGISHGVSIAGFSLGTLELSLDRPAEALAVARAATSATRHDGYREPALYLSFAIHVETAIALGELREAEDLVDWIEERAVRLDREAVLAQVFRCRGLLAAARGDEAGATAAFERALAEHGRVAYRRFDLARTLLVQGETLRRFRRKRAARDAIDAATAIFDELGAALWSAKARRELARVSGRRSGDGLTVTERRVAELVAEGLSTKQVAATLVVSPKTVEGHLSRIYAKLDVRSRAQLARLLGDERTG